MFECYYVDLYSSMMTSHISIFFRQYGLSLYNPLDLFDWTQIWIAYTFHLTKLNFKVNFNFSKIWSLKFEKLGVIIQIFHFLFFNFISSTKIKFHSKFHLVRFIRSSK